MIHDMVTPMTSTAATRTSTRDADQMPRPMAATDSTTASAIDALNPRSSASAIVTDASARRAAPADSSADASAPGPVIIDPTSPSRCALLAQNGHTSGTYSTATPRRSSDSGSPGSGRRPDRALYRSRPREGYCRIDTRLPAPGSSGGADELQISLLGLALLSLLAIVPAMRMPDYREGELPAKLEPDDDDPIDEVVDPDRLEAHP